MAAPAKAAPAKTGVVDFGKITATEAEAPSAESTSKYLAHPFVKHLRETAESKTWRKFSGLTREAAEQGRAELTKVASALKIGHVKRVVDESTGATVSPGDAGTGPFSLVFQGRSERKHYNGRAPYKPKQKKGESDADFKVRQAKYAADLAAYNAAKGKTE